MSDKNQQRFQVGDLVSFEEDGWYYQSLIHGVCYHKESEQWSYVIVVFNKFHHIWSSSDVDKLTLLKKSETSIDTDVQINKVVKRKQIYRGYITKSHEIKETLLMAAKLIEGISEDDILNLHSLDDYSCDIVEITYNFIRSIINYVCSYSDNDYEFVEGKGLIVQLKDNGNQRIDTPLYEFIKFELKPIIDYQLQLKINLQDITRERLKQEKLRRK